MHQPWDGPRTPSPQGTWHVTVPAGGREAVLYTEPESHPALGSLSVTTSPCTSILESPENYLTPSQGRATSDQPAPPLKCSPIYHHQQPHWGPSFQKCRTLRGLVEATSSASSRGIAFREHTGHQTHLYLLDSSSGCCRQ